MADLPESPSLSLRRPLLIGFWGSIALMLILVGWANLTGIAGAVVASGEVSAGGKPKQVQHLDGGVVAKIFVADGDRVRKGDLLLRLDDRLLRANLAIYLDRYAELLARRDRLLAERDGLPAPVFTPPAGLLANRSLTAFQQAEIATFHSRADLQSGRRSQLAERIGQYENQIGSVTALLQAKQEQEAMVSELLARQRKLLAKGLTRQADVMALAQSRSEILGQIDGQQAEIARIRNAIADTRLEVLQTGRQFREETVAELGEVSARIETLLQQINGTQSQLDRVAITAPVSGFVHELQVVTVGGVVPPGAVISQIIPDDRSRSFDLKVPAVSVDQIFVGQEVRLRFPAFNQRTTPELIGKVAVISASSVQDEATRIHYYRIKVDVGPDELARLGADMLLPGMPVQGFLGTGERSVASYLIRPVVEQMQLAFREN
ncbi:MAG: HlyD family type I secretion periplasmic adaptor subunit [Paracoccaceae bacterium]